LRQVVLNECSKNIFELKNIYDKNNRILKNIFRCKRCATKQKWV